MNRPRLALVVLLVLVLGAIGFFAVRARRETARRPSSAAGAQSRDTLKAEELARALRDGNWETRFGAVRATPRQSAIPAAQRADLLLDLLTREIAAPASGEPPVGSYLEPTQLLRLHAAQALGELGSGAQPSMRARLQKAAGEEREWILLGLGYAADSAVAPQLRQTLSSSRSGVVRMTSAHVLGKLRDSAAAPQLEAALGDRFSARVAHNDVGEAGEPVRYPVRDRAASALRKLGYRVDYRGSLPVLVR